MLRTFRLSTQVINLSFAVNVLGCQCQKPLELFSLVKRSEEGERVEEREREREQLLISQERKREKLMHEKEKTSLLINSNNQPKGGVMYLKKLYQHQHLLRNNCNNQISFQRTASFYLGM